MPSVTSASVSSAMAGSVCRHTPVFVPSQMQCAQSARGMSGPTGDEFSSAPSVLILYVKTISSNIR